MLGRVRSLVRREMTTGAADVSATDLRSEVRRLQLDLAERDKRLARTTEELERQRASQASQVEEEVAARVERLLADVSAPVAQLVTQAHLVDVEDKVVAPKDILIVVRRLVRCLQDNGLELVGTIDAEAQFNPNVHEPLSSAEVTISAGETVRVRFVGTGFKGKVLRKAGVQKEG